MAAERCGTGWHQSFFSQSEECSHRPVSWAWSPVHSGVGVFSLTQGQTATGVETGRSSDPCSIVSSCRPALAQGTAVQSGCDRVAVVNVANPPARLSTSSAGLLEGEQCRIPRARPSAGPAA